MTLARQKQDLRQTMLARRARLRAEFPDADKTRADEARAKHFLDAIPLAAGAAVSAYAAIGDEADPKPLLEHLWARKHSVLLPRVNGKGKPLGLHVYPHGGTLHKGPFGLSEPPADWPEAVPQVLIVPLLAFDAHGNRLGYGAGFYDRTLALLRGSHAVLAVGYAYAGQEVDAVPYHAGDQKLDWVVTETAARKFGARKF